MKYLITILFTISFLNAGITDVFKIKKAQEAFSKGDYNASIEAYSKVKDKDAKLHYNLGEAYYRAGRYKEALREFKAVNDKALEFKKLHNIGNTLAKLGKIDDAVKAYEKALKIKEDKDTRYNLELLKKLKNRQKNKQNKKNQKKNQKKQNQKNQSGQNQQKQNGKNKKQNKNSKQKQNNKQNGQNQQNKNTQNKNQKQNSQKQNAQNKKQEQKQKSQNGQKKQDKKREQKQNAQSAQKKKGEKKKQKGAQGAVKKVPISDMELRKYNKMLDKRGIKTLLIPLQNKGAKSDKKIVNPW